MNSWWNNPDIQRRPNQARGKAQRYADNRFKRNDIRWKLCYQAFLSGYLKSQREKFAEIRLKIKT